MPSRRAESPPRQQRVTPPSGTVTFLFTDIEGSTRLAQQRTEDYERLLDRHRSLLRQSFERRSGYEVGTEGDSFFVAFASPAEALLAAAEGQRALAGEKWPQNAEIRVRMGLHVGEAVVRDGDYVGVEIHRAARIAAVGHGGQILASGAVTAVVGERTPDDLAFRQMGEFGLKDFDAPARIFQLTGPGLRADFPPLRAPSARRTNLPQRRSSFIGRKQERAAVIRALRASRLVTLTGPGGSGKTSLAVEVARDGIPDYADGAWFAECAALRDPDYVATTVGHVLGVAEDPTRSANEVLAAYLSPRDILLVLDNLEQLLPEVALFVDGLLDTAGGLRVLATSREPLHITGEQELAVPPLSLPDASPAPNKLAATDAIRLFVDRARAVDSHFNLTEANREPIIAIVRRLDGLPLAIELAAARVKLLSPAEILERLSHGSAGLGQSAAPRPERQRTLRDAIGWSYRLLTASEQAFLARLAAFSGGATLDSAEAVCNPNGDLGIDSLDAMASLVDKSLLRRVESPSGSRFEMLETIRDFAREELAKLDPRGAAATRHARHMADLADLAQPEITRADPSWRIRLGAELDNMRAALAWALENDDSEIAMRLCWSLWRFWQIRALLTEGREWCDRTLAMAPSGAPNARHIRAQLAAGSLAYWQRDWDAANRLYRAAVAEAEALGDERVIADSLLNLNFLVSVYPQTAISSNEIETIERRVKDLGERLQDPLMAASADFARAGPLLVAGRIDEARRRMAHTLQILEASGDVFLAGSANSLAGGMALLAGDMEEARAKALASVEYLYVIGDQIASQMMFRALAMVAARMGEHERAARLHGFAARLVADTGGVRFSPPFEAEDALEVVRAAIGEERADEAWRLGQQLSHDEAIELARGIGAGNSA